MSLMTTHVHTTVMSMQQDPFHLDTPVSSAVSKCNNVAGSHRSAESPPCCKCSQAQVVTAFLMHGRTFHVCHASHIHACVQRFCVLCRAASDALAAQEVVSVMINVQEVASDDVTPSRCSTTS